MTRRNIHVPDKIWDYLSQVSNATGISASEIIRRAIVRYLRDYTSEAAIELSAKIAELKAMSKQFPFGQAGQAGETGLDSGGLYVPEKVVTGHRQGKYRPRSKKEIEFYNEDLPRIEDTVSKAKGHTGILK